MKIISYSAGLLVLVFLAACSEPQANNSGNTSDTASAKSIALEVFKTPTCGCCSEWVSHIEKRGFSAKVHDKNSLDELKASLGIPELLQSCHTGVSEEGYFFEGHIPAKFIKQFLASPPADAAGLTVPGMPLGSPGMEVKDRFQPYSIVLVMKDGRSKVYAKIATAEEQF